MRTRLLLVIALAVLGAVIAASAAQGSGVISTGESGVSINLPQGADLPSVAGGVLPGCSNLADDDGDGAVDMGDPGCSGPLDGDESNPAPPTTTTPNPPPPQPEPSPTPPSGSDEGGPITGHIGPEGSGAPGTGTIESPGGSGEQSGGT